MTTTHAFPKLFEPAHSRGMHLRNRIFLSPMGVPGKDFRVTEPMVGYFAARAAGGAGMVMVGALGVQFPEGVEHLKQLRLDDDSYIKGFELLTQAVHKHDCRAMLQINHYGPAVQSDQMNVQPVAPSALARTPSWAHPKYWQARELSVAEIEHIVGLFAAAAGRAQKAGFDGVEVDGGLRYLLNAFLSPAWNKRQDQYGGDLKNRARFMLEVVRAVRQTVGPDYPVWCRINSKERQTKGGLTVELQKELAPMLEQAGIDVIDVAVQLPHSPDYAPGFNAREAAEVKKTVKIPVAAGGRIDIWMAEKLLRQNQADFIAMGRALIAEPELPNLASSGALDDISPCVYCNCCLPPQQECTVNAARYKEAEYEIKPAAKVKKVLIVGGGPGGMEAARVAALRGHKVTLYDRGYHLGGQLIMASLLRGEYVALLDYLTRQVRKLGVEVRLKQNVDAKVIAAMKPDAVVVATGATFSAPAVPGIDRPNVLSSSDMQQMVGGHAGHSEAKARLTWRRFIWRSGAVLLRSNTGLRLMRRVLGAWAPFGHRVVIMGSGLAGCELGDFLARQGKKVTIVGSAEDTPFGEPPMIRMRDFWKDRISKNGGAIITGARWLEVTDRGLVFEKDGARQTIEADSIMLTSGYKPDGALAEALGGGSLEVHRIGDGVSPAGILEAIRDGSRVGRLL